MAHTKHRAAHDAKRGLTEWQRRVALDIAQAHPMEPVNEQPTMRPFLVQIKNGPEVVLEFGVMGPDSITVAQQHECLCEAGQVVRVTPRLSEGSAFPVQVALHEVAEVELRELSQAELLAGDLERNRRKGEKAREQNDRRALEAQVMSADAMRLAGWL